MTEHIGGYPSAMPELTGRHLATRMAEFARLAAPPARLDDLLPEVTAAAVELIPGADMAGILLTAGRGQLTSLASTADIVRRLHEFQEHYNEGPCVDAATDQLAVRVNDFATEQRWPRLSREAVALGIRSNLSFRLYGSNRTAGALNVFGTEPDVFSAESEAIGLVLASHAAAAILASRQGEQLESAVASRDTIGQAKGVIMERFDIDAVQAFNLLRRLSQTENVRLAEIAQRVVDTRGDRD